MKTSSCSATTLLEALPLPLVIPTGAQRSGRTCGSAALSWKCFSTDESWAYGPPQGDETAFVQQRLCLEALTSPLSSRPERSAVEGPAVWRLFLGNVFRPKRNPDFLLRTANKYRSCGFPQENRMVLINVATSKGNPGERIREPALSEVEWGSAVSARLAIPLKVNTITYIRRSSFLAWQRETRLRCPAFHHHLSTVAGFCHRPDMKDPLRSA
jgi:hypothetical protein